MMWLLSRCPHVLILLKVALFSLVITISLALADFNSGMFALVAYDWRNGSLNTAFGDNDLTRYNFTVH